MHKHLQEVTKNVFSWKKLYIDFLMLLTEKHFTIILKTMILSALVNSVANTEEAAIGGVLKIQIKVSQNPRESTARVSFLIKSDTGVFL